MDIDPKLAWFRDGLQFTCTQCGDCCTGAPGFVWINQEEIETMAARVGESVDNFKRIYTRDIGTRKSLRELPNGDCVFFRHGVGCTIYEARPRQCRTWPFWDSNINNRESWKRTCEICPGSGQGQLVTAEDIIAQSKQIKI